MRHATGLVLAAVLALAAGGCGESMRLDNPLLLRGVNADVTENVARRALEDLRFEIEYPEASEGHIATRGLTGASWFEFWREDTLGTDQRIESSLHTTRRRVTMAITPVAAGSEIFVKVTKERLTAPNTGPESIGETYSLYGFQISKMYERDEIEPTRYKWIDVGRDDLLEQEILARLERRLQPLPPKP
jgi:hypothetical protein